MKRSDCVLLGAAILLCAGTCLVAKLTTPPFDLQGVAYQAAASTTAAAATKVTESAINTSFKGKVDLNTATREELMTLDGVGESLADRIVRYRETHGGFSSVEELLQVQGIGEKRLAGWLDRIFVS